MNGKTEQNRVLQRLWEATRRQEGVKKQIRWRTAPKRWREGMALAVLRSNRKKMLILVACSELLQSNGGLEQRIEEPEWRKERQWNRDKQKYPNISWVQMLWGATYHGFNISWVQMLWGPEHSRRPAEHSKEKQEPHSQALRTGRQIPQGHPGTVHHPSSMPRQTSASRIPLQEPGS